MITNFEDITHELTDRELSIVKILVKVLRVRIGKSKAITNKKIVHELNRVLNIKKNGPRIRKMIHYIRISGEVENLIATSKGYYVSESKEELKGYLDSLHERVNSINEIINQLDYQMNKI